MWTAEYKPSSKALILRFRGSDTMTDISIVVPMRNEAPNVRPLLKELLEACPSDDYEFIAVDDGSTDATHDELLAFQSLSPRLRVLRHASSGGQTAAIHNGVLAAKGRIICTIDGDGQNPPEEVKRLVDCMLGCYDAGVGLIAGQRVGRKDTLAKRWASVAANGIRRAILKDGTRDTGCGLKCFRRDAFIALPYFNHMHRYLPALFTRDGWKVRLIDVNHRERLAGSSNYSNLKRALQGVIDLVGVSWLVLRRKTVTAQESKPEVPRDA